MDASWFQDALARTGASHADLARYLQLAPSAISRMLKSQRQMKLAEAVRIADFLGLSSEEMLHHAGSDLATAPSTAVNAPRRGRPPQARNPPALSPALAETIPIEA
jgi:plasmid maintenance system antidote protein VapI